MVCWVSADKTLGGSSNCPHGLLALQLSLESCLTFGSSVLVPAFVAMANTNAT